MKKKKTIVGDKLTKIVLSQKILGFWEFNSDLADLLFLSEEEILKKCPSELLEKNHLWVTMLVANYLRQNFSEKMGSLTLILEKAEEYLKDNGVDPSEYQSKVGAIFETKSLL